MSNNIKEAFETWVRENYVYTSLDKFFTGNYEDEKAQHAWRAFQAGVKHSLTTDWELWPEQSPEIGSRCEIWIPETGNQFTTFAVGTKGKAPYFFWCGSPKKVWWRYIKPPIDAKES